jgi:hypothetical protein
MTSTPRRSCALTVMEHEIGNRHDKHATKVMRINGEQLGYLPQGLAHDLIEGYWTDSGCDYWAVNLGVERMGGDTDLLTARILVLVSLPGSETIQEKVKRELTRLGITDVSPESVNWQPLRGAQRAQSVRLLPVGETRIRQLATAARRAAGAAWTGFGEGAAVWMLRDHPARSAHRRTIATVSAELTNECGRRHYEFENYHDNVLQSIRLYSAG